LHKEETFDEILRIEIPKVNPKCFLYLRLINYLQPLNTYLMIRFTIKKHITVVFSCFLLAIQLFSQNGKENQGITQDSRLPALPAPTSPPVVKEIGKVGEFTMGNPDEFEEVKLSFPIAKGPFEPTWESINKNYQNYPEWLREAKFGIWVHFGPQASGMSGDWYARRMYEEGEPAYTNHIRDFGHPSLEGMGYKDVLHSWNPEKLNPQELVQLYFDAGARFLFVQGVHHDNYDLWDSKYQPWNSVNIGPKRDLLSEWSSAVKTAGMHFGITFHHEYTWWWWSSAFRGDTDGKYKGTQYDGNLTVEDGKGKWWEGYDPRMLYGIDFGVYQGIGVERYAPKQGIFTHHLEYAEWYATNWALRILDAVEKYDPDFIYTDGNHTQPFSGYKSGTGYKCDAMQRVIASYYNRSLLLHGDVDVFSIVKFHPAGRNGIVTTFEGKFPKTIKTDQAWIGENPLGDWYYAPDFVYSPDAVIRFLIECVSRDGCYAVSIPITPDGSLEPGCLKMLKDIGDWMKINGEAIYGSKAWVIEGESKDSLLRRLPGGKIGAKQANFVFDKDDLRFTVGKDGDLYIFCMTIPESGEELKIKSLAGKENIITSVSILGDDKKPEWNHKEDGLYITCPETSKFNTAMVFKVVLYE
jgi:alpha-L-fucosidase